jgi:hypothetical protein
METAAFALQHYANGRIVLQGDTYNITVFRPLDGNHWIEIDAVRKPCEWPSQDVLHRESRRTTE